MADTDHRTVASITREGRGPQTHAYDDPDIGPIEFLLAVMRAQHLPMATRISAASAAMPFTTPRPNTNSFRIGCRIIIPDMPELFQRQGQGPRTPANEFIAKDPEQINTISQSFPLSAETPGPINTETNSTPQTLVDYSTPPTPAELQEIKAAINALRPDLSHLPVPEPRFCECGHWVFGYYSCCSAASRKLN